MSADLQLVLILIFSSIIVCIIIELLFELLSKPDFDVCMHLNMGVLNVEVKSKGIVIDTPYYGEIRDIGNAQNRMTEIASRSYTGTGRGIIIVLSNCDKKFNGERITEHIEELKEANGTLRVNMMILSQSEIFRLKKSTNKVVECSVADKI